MIAVLRKGDDRVKAEILEEILLRRTRFGEWCFTYHGVDDISSCLAGRPLFTFFASTDAHSTRGYSIAQSLWRWANPTAKRRLRASFKFKEPIAFSCGEEALMLHELKSVLPTDTDWLCQTVRLDATLGIYDYLRGRVRLASGENQYVIQDVNWDTAQPCDPPEGLTLRSTGLLRGEIDVALIMNEGLNIGEAPELPQLESHVVPRDLECKLPAEV